MGLAMNFMYVAHLHVVYHKTGDEGREFAYFLAPEDAFQTNVFYQEMLKAEQELKENILNSGVGISTVECTRISVAMSEVERWRLGHAVRDIEVGRDSTFYIDSWIIKRGE